VAKVRRDFAPEYARNGRLRRDADKDGKGTGKVNRLAIVTGASTGIGRALAGRCADAGYDLILAADEPEIEEAAAQLRHRAGRSITRLDEQLRLLDTNIRGTVLLLRATGQRMRERGEGRILITSSIAAFAPAPFNALYNASKAFLYSLSFALRNEFADHGVSVTCLLPGLTQSAVFRARP
jgi:short-subunit dehydrogenase